LSVSHRRSARNATVTGTLTAAVYAAVSARLGDFVGAAERLHELIRVSCSLEPIQGLPSGWDLWFDLWARRSAIRTPPVTVLSSTSGGGRWSPRSSVTVNAPATSAVSMRTASLRR